MATNNTNWITEQDIKKIGAIQVNVDPSKVIPYIDIAQDNFIRNFLGDAMYDSLAEQINNDSLTADSDDGIIVEMIKPALAWFTHHEALVFMQYQTTNKGVLTKNSTNSVAPSDEDFNKVFNKTLANGNIYLAKVKRYIDDNRDLYPLYRPICYCSGVCQCGASYDQGILFYD